MSARRIHAVCSLKVVRIIYNKMFINNENPVYAVKYCTKVVPLTLSSLNDEYIFQRIKCSATIDKHNLLST